jgi:hypothetical protein
MIILGAFDSEGGDYLDNEGSSGSTVVEEGGSSTVFISSSGRRIFRGSSSSRRRRLSCSESVLGTTNCPLVLAYSGLGTAVTFCGHIYFGFKVYFLRLIKYTHDYPHTCTVKHIYSITAGTYMP